MDLRVLPFLFGTFATNPYQRLSLTSHSQASPIVFSLVPHTPVIFMPSDWPHEYGVLLSFDRLEARWPQNTQQGVHIERFTYYPATLTSNHLPHPPIILVTPVLIIRFGFSSYSISAWYGPWLQIDLYNTCPLIQSPYNTTM